MKSIGNKFDFSRIIDGIRQGTVSRLYVIKSGVYEDDPCDAGDFIYEYDELCFAGTTEAECLECLSLLADGCHPDIYTYVEFTANYIEVSQDSISSFDTEDGDPEDCIASVVDANIEDACELQVKEAERTVCFPYQSMEGGIILRWRWVTHIGYAREALDFCLCCYNRSTLLCKPVDKVYATQVTLLVTPEEMKDIKTASRLRDCIQQGIDSMGRWRNNTDVDDTLRDIYMRFHALNQLYLLPKNDCYDFGQS